MLTKDTLELSIGTVPINTSHRVGLQWWVYVDKKAPYDLGALMFSIFLNIPHTGVNADFQALSEWVDGYKPKTINHEPHEKVFDIVADYAKLWALFKYKFNIDLDSDELHWHKFLALFDIVLGAGGLDDIVKYRAYSAGKNDSPEYQQAMMKLKNIHKLCKNDEVILDSVALTKKVIEQKKAVMKNGN